MRKGTKMTIEQRERLSLAHIGISSPKKDIGAISRICKQCKTPFTLTRSRFYRKYCSKKCDDLRPRKPAWNKGISFRAEIPKPWVSERMKGNKYAFKGSIQRQERNDPAYHVWVKAIKKRDGNNCQFKNENCSQIIVVHHILPWRDYPEERYNINNGIVLCQYHHPRKWIDEQRLIPVFQELVGSKTIKL